MSKTDCQACPTTCTGQRFKGVENFLKRIAFNLGNSPSQTEVKIISCIPIDVSDLQQKIMQLERQLDEVRCRHKKTINTALCNNKFAVMSHTAVTCNSLDVDRSTSPRTANILSLKNKSYNSFEEHSSHKDALSVSSHPDDVPATSEIIAPTSGNRPYRRYLEIMDGFKPFTTSESKEHEGRKRFFKKKKFMKNKNSKPSAKTPNSQYIYYAQTSNTPFSRSNAVDYGSKKNHTMPNSYLADVIKRQYKPRALAGNFSDTSRFSSPICRDMQDCSVSCRYESDICSCCHGQFHNIDNHTSDVNLQTLRANQMNTDGGYYDSTLYDMIPVKENPVKVKKTLVVPKKSIDIKCWPEKVRAKLRTYPMYGPLYFEDNNLRPTVNLKAVRKMNKKAPIPNNIWKHKREVYNDWRIGNIDMDTARSCSINFGRVYPKVIVKKTEANKWFEPTTVPSKTDAGCLTTVINDSECQTSSNELPIDKTEATLNQIKNILQCVLQEVKVSSVSKTSEESKNVIQKEGSQNNVKDNDMNNKQGSQQDTTQCNIEDRVQTKAPGSIQSSLPINMPGTTPCNIQGSSLLQNFSYSPYSVNPYLPSCSKHLGSNQYHIYPNSPMRCVQNFPLFIQTQGRQMCSSCYRHNTPTKPGYRRHGTTIATNTDDVKEASTSKETEKLIKEIYKSMAMSMGVPNKNISSSDFGNVKSIHTLATNRMTRKAVTKPQPVRDVNKVVDAVHAVSELFKKKDLPISSETPNTITESGSTPNDASTRSQSGATDVEVRLRKQRLAKYLDQNKRALYDEGRKPQRIITQHSSTPTTSDSEIDDSDTDTTYVPENQARPEKKRKSSLFSKMVNSMKQGFIGRGKKRNKEPKEESPEEESSSDSDDYQTIYSQKIEVPQHKPRTHVIPKRRTHSKISYKNTYQRERSPERTKRQPYMEQEYRRHWNENLMFQNKYKEPSHHYHHETRRPPFYQTYEARPTMVAPITPHAPRIAENIVAKDKDESPKIKLPAKGLAWFKKHKIGHRCGEQWKKFILEN